jgi:hypothetical protein
MSLRMQYSTRNEGRLQLDYSTVYYVIGHTKNSPPAYKSMDNKQVEAHTWA